MGIFYPIRADAPEDADLGYDDFAHELSEVWIVQVSVVDEDGEETEPVAFGPYSPRHAWELGHDLDDRAPDGLNVELNPLYRSPNADEILSEVMPSDPPTVSS